MGSPRAGWGLRNIPPVGTESKRLVLVWVFLALLASAHSPGEAREVSEHPELEVARGPRGDSPAESASGHRAPVSCALEDRARPGRVAERGRLCGTALRSPRALRGRLVARVPAARPCPGPLTCGLPGPPRARLRPALCADRRRSGLCHLRAPTPAARPDAPPRPRPERDPAAPPPGQQELHTAQLPSAAARRGT